MRHLVKGRKLGRTPSHRKATLNALSVALLREHRIVTTEAKAKELRTYVEPIITKAKEDTTHNRRQVFSKLQNKKVVSHLFNEVAQKAMDRPGGYTRVIKVGNRPGDGAKMAVIELVDYNDIKPEDSHKKKRTRRAGKSSKSTSSGGNSDDKAKAAASSNEEAADVEESSGGNTEEE
ncbi:50S ribosomal protein L17 [Fodinibius sediminis]|uniref:Large ribosomal subunit protein bL17 n=1 Tax=Fodinibius sediminis TaxID=1214077 RepID=A0A521FBC2_9BACT|nr:LSU ribosomal protein L17P [Fodinibius sediminis]